MNKNQNLEDLKEIRQIMERSSRFISLSGLSGIVAGVLALAGSFVAYVYLLNIAAHNILEKDTFANFFSMGTGNPKMFTHYNVTENTFSLIKIDNISLTVLIIIGIIVLTGAVLSGILLTVRNAKSKGLAVWDNTAKRVLINLLIPLITGGIFCIALYYYSFIFLIIPSMLIFYGLALINASKYTLNDIRYFGMIQIIIGIAAMIIPSYGIFIWGIGFGLFHILYGTFMYFKYEQ